MFDLNGLFLQSVHQSINKTTNDYDFKGENGYYIYIRPFTKLFFEYVFNNCEVGFWTTLNLQNTTYILQKLVSHGCFTENQFQNIKVVYTKENCVNYGEYYDNNKPILYKDLHVLWNEKCFSDYKTRTVLIDVNNHRISLNPKQNIVTPSKYCHLNLDYDDELIRLRNYIEFLVLGVNCRLMNKNNYTSLTQVNSYELFEYPYKMILKNIDENESYDNMFQNNKKTKKKCIFKRIFEFVNRYLYYFLFR